jgi:pimeloyl-ACP methyl ester carboxylesterase
MPALAAHCTTYALDLPGMGASAKPVAVRYTLDFHARTLAGFLDALELERASIVCHDIGGMVGLLFAARAPERLDRLVVMDTLPYPELPPALAPMLAAGRVPGLRQLLVRRAVIRYLLRLGTPNARARIDELTDMYYRPFADDTAARRVLLRTLLEGEVGELAEAVRGFGGITAPTLILWAEKDWLLPPSYARRLERDIPGATLQLVPRCSHFLPEDRPDFVTGELLRFLVPNHPNA